MPFHLTWEALGRGQGNINYYTIDTRRFGGWEYAVPLDCYQALNAAGYMNQLGVANAAEPV